VACKEHNYVSQARVPLEVAARTRGLSREPLRVAPTEGHIHGTVISDAKARAYIQNRYKWLQRVRRTCVCVCVYIYKTVKMSACWAKTAKKATIRPVFAR
jgi:hypothetical protein